MESIKKILPYFIIIGIVVLIRAYVFTPITVNGASMEQSFYNGDVVLLKKMYNNIKRFDVVVIDLKDGKPLIKRVVGLPGEYVEYKDSNLYINNKLVEESFIKEDTNDFKLTELGYQIIPDDMYFVMGDNRDDSMDSRIIGLIKRDSIVGKASIILFPFSRLGIAK